MSIMRTNLPDVQSRDDSRGVILKAGITDVILSVHVMDQLTQIPVMATFNMFVELPASRKGLNMSRFGQVVNRFSKQKILSKDSMLQLACDLRSAHGDSKFAVVKAKFQCLYNQSSPVTNNGGPVPFTVRTEASISNGTELFYESVSLMVMTVCPCSLEMSGGNSSHSQRAEVEIRCQVKEWIPLDELYNLASQGSENVYFTLKRPDEKAAVGRAFENPKFAEDVVRDVTVGLQEDERVEHFSVVITSKESIHPYNVTAIVDSWEQKDGDDSDKGLGKEA